MTQTLKQNKFTFIAIGIATIALAVGLIWGNFEQLKEAFGNANLTEPSACATAAATSTRSTIGSSVGGVIASSTLISGCSSPAMEKVALYWTNEASSSAQVFYDVYSSRDNIQFHYVNSYQITLGNNATTSDYDLIDPLFGNWFRIVARSSATTSAHLRAVPIELLSR